MSKYKVSFTLENNRKRVCIVEAYNRFRAMASAILQTSIRKYKDVEIKAIKA
jgi:hypothetical protein